MRLLLLLGVGFLFSVAFSQAPQGYYDTTENLSGFALKTELAQILTENHIPQEYSSVWSFFEAHEATVDGTVRDLFSDCDFAFGQPEFGGNQDIGMGGNVECEYFNREHTFPSSWFGGSSNVLYTDIHHLWPTDKYVNGVRSTFVFAEVNNPSFISENGSELGPSATPGLTGTAFEVLDEYKGDIARAYFYIATRYQGEIASWQGNNADGDKILSGNASTAYQNWAITMMYEWHLNDPVDDYEIARNNAAFAFQGNRNPFIDHPEWVCEIWNTEDNCTLSIPQFENAFSLSVYPNPATGSFIFIESSTPIEGISLYAIHGKSIFTKENTSSQKQKIQLNISQLSKGVYFLKVKSNYQQITKKLIVR